MDLMEFCKQMSDTAYEQELNREKVIGTKTEYLFKWLTLLVAIFNIAIPIIAKETSVDYSSVVFVVLYVLMMVCLAGAMALVVFINFPRKMKKYPSGTEWMKRIKSHPDKFKNENDFVYQSILCKDVVVEKLKKSNNKAVFCMAIANVLVLVALIFMAIFFGYIIWG